MKKIFSFWPLFLFLFLTAFLFRQYVFSGKVPFAGNLLVSFYQPWKSYTWSGYGKNGPANKPIGFDSLRIFYPLRSLTIESLKKFELPLWNPYDFAGNTQLATYQSAVFFPLTPLFLIFPQIDGWSLTVFLEPLLASWFMYMFLRSLSLSKKSSVIGSLAFGFSGGIIVLSEESFMAVYSLIVLPLILLGMHKFFEDGRFRWFSLTAISLLSSILSGWFQSTFYVMTFSFIWLVFLSFWKKSIKGFFLGLLTFIISLFLAGPHVVPNIESYLYSARGTTDAKFLFDIYLLPVWHLITYFIPDLFGNPATYNYFDNGFYYEKILYVGIAGIFLGLVALFKIKKTPEEWFFTMLWLITVSLGLSLPTSWFLLYYLHLPLVSTILPSRIFLLSSFCISVMASYGTESLLKKPQKISFLLASSINAVVFGITWIMLLHQKSIYPLGNFATISYRNVLLPSILVFSIFFSCIFFFFRKKYFRTLAYIAILVISISGIIYFSNKYLFFSDRYFTFPNTPVITKLSKIIGNNRFWSFGNGYIERNFATFYHLQSVEGYDSFYIRSFGELAAASKNGGKFTTNIPRADAQLTGVSRLSEIPSNPLLFKTLNLLGVKYILAKNSLEDETFIQQNSQQIFKQIWTDTVYSIYENEKALPRTFFVDSYEIVPNANRQLKAIFNLKTDLSKTVILDSNPNIGQIKNNLVANATITSYENEKVVVKTKSNKTAVLILSDNMYPGWIATVDGKITKIFTADHTLRSVVVPGGDHTVIFSYQPLSLKIGFASFFVGLLLFGITGFTITRKLQK